MKSGKYFLNERAVLADFNQLKRPHISDEMSRDFRKKFRKIKENQDLYRGKYYKMKAKNRGENMILEIVEASKNKGYEFPRTHIRKREVISRYEYCFIYVFIFASLI